MGEGTGRFDDALAVLSSGEPLPEELACADPDDRVRALTEDAGSWPVVAYEVIGVSALTPATPGSLWYVGSRGR
jgi:hypothetical protein